MTTESLGSALGHGIGAILGYAAVGLVLILVGFFAVDLTTPGNLRNLIRESKPNAVYITSAGMVSMALIVLTAIFSSGGDLARGLLTSAVFGLVGIIVQVVIVRIVDVVTGVDMKEIMYSDVATPGARLVAAAHVAAGLVVAMAVL